MSTDSDNLFEDGFAAIRIGIREHIEAGQFSATELGIYTFLHLWSRFDCGIIWTTAASIKNTMKHKDVKLRTVQNALNRMRKKEYIDYKKGDGSGWAYPVLIVKATVTAGVLKGCRTISFYDKEKEWVLYDITKAKFADAVRTLCASLYGPKMVEVRKVWGEGAVVVHLQDIKTGRLFKNTRIQDTQDPPAGEPEVKSKKVGL